MSDDTRNLFNATDETEITPRQQHDARIAAWVSLGLAIGASAVTGWAYLRHPENAKAGLGAVVTFLITFGLLFLFSKPDSDEKPSSPADEWMA